MNFSIDLVNFILLLILLFFLLSICNFLIKIAESLNYIKKEISDYYYLLREQNSKNEKKPDSGLIDIPN